MEETLYNLINNVFNIRIDEFRRCISTIINTFIEYEAIREKLKEHEENCKLFRYRYRKTNRLNSQVHNKKHICRCRSTI